MSGTSNKYLGRLHMLRTKRRMAVCKRLCFQLSLERKTGKEEKKEVSIWSDGMERQSERTG